MPTAQSGPHAVRSLLAIRASRLDSAGAPLCLTTNGSAWDPCPVSIAKAARTVAEVTAELRCGDGSLIDQEVTPETVTGDTVTLIVAKNNKSLIALLTGATPILVGGGPVIGYIEPDPDDVIPKVEFNAWSRNRLNSAPAASPYRFSRDTWTQTTWRFGDSTRGSDYSTVTLVGTSTPNNSIKGGTFDDYPMLMDGKHHAQWDTDFVPAATVAPYSTTPTGGYIDTPACAS